MQLAFPSGSGIPLRERRSTPAEEGSLRETRGYLVDPAEEAVLHHLYQTKIRRDEHQQYAEEQRWQRFEAECRIDRRQHDAESQNNREADADEQGCAWPAPQRISKRTDDKDDERLSRQRLDKPAGAEQFRIGVKHKEHHAEC